MKNNSNFHRFDLVFSYWIYLWYVLYIFKFTTITPKFAIIIGIIENTILLLLISIYGSNIKTIIKFLIMMFIFKLLPYYYVKDTKININNIIITFILFFVYLIWIHINNVNFKVSMKDIFDSLINNKNKTPFMYFFKKFLNF